MRQTNKVFALSLGHKPYFSLSIEGKKSLQYSRKRKIYTLILRIFALKFSLKEGFSEGDNI